jgi:hypothetical protein
VVPIQLASNYFENSGRDSAAFKNHQLSIDKYTHLLSLFTGHGFAGVTETNQPWVYVSWNYNGTTAPDVGSDPNLDDHQRSADKGEIEIGPGRETPAR